jgi:hypothetical protein
LNGPTTSSYALMAWAEQWAKEGVAVGWEKLLPPRGFIALPRRWVVERTFAWLSHNRRMSKDYERLCATSEAFIYVAMSRLMVRRLARAQNFSDTLSRQLGKQPSPEMRRPSLDGMMNPATCIKLSRPSSKGDDGYEC